MLFADGLCRAFQPLFDADASVVTISISTTRMASENYGYMAPVKAALDSAIVFLAKVLQPVLARAVQRRGAGAVENVGFGRHSRLRRRVSLCRAGDAAQSGLEDRGSGRAPWRFCLSPRSSGINAQRIVVDAGMEVNYFDRELVERAMRPE